MVFLSLYMEARPGWTLLFLKGWKAGLGLDPAWRRIELYFRPQDFPDDSDIVPILE